MTSAPPSSLTPPPSGYAEWLAHDLRTAFPGMLGFSPRNLKYMPAFAQAWPDAEFVQQAAAQLSWFHLCALIDKPQSELALELGGVVGEDDAP